MFLFLVSLCLLSALLMFPKCSRKYTESLSPLPPGPKPWPVVGCIFEMVRKKPTFRWIHKIMDQMNTEIACIRIGSVYVIPVTSPELCCEFLKNQDSNFSSRPLCMSAELISNGYLTTALTPSFGEYRHKKMKGIIVSEVLSSARHKWLRAKRDEEADNLLRYVYSQVRGGSSVINVRTVARHYCGNVIRKLIFNKRFFGNGGKNGGPGVEEEEHVDAIFTLLAKVYAFGVSDYIPSLKMFDIDGHRKILKTALQTVRKYQDPEIDDRIKIWEKGFKTSHEDLLDVLITVKDDNGKALLSSEEIKAQITVRIPFFLP